MNQTNKKVIIIGIVVLIIAVGVFIYLRNFANDDELLTSTLGESNSEVKLLRSEIISALNEIDSIKLDNAIFDNPSFKSLKDFSQEIPKEPVGKSNLFSPIRPQGSNRVLEVAQ